MKTLFLLFPAVVSGQVVLSEIMFNPAGNERTDEYVELINISQHDTVDMAGWLLSDGSKYCVITAWQDSCTLLVPGQYAIVLLPGYMDSHFYDPSIPANARRLSIDQSAFGAYGLSNSKSETVSLFTPDTVLTSAWAYSVPNKDGYSEEKKIPLRGDEPFNWDNSLREGGTPGFKNSNTPIDFDLELRMPGLDYRPVAPNRGDTLTVRIVVYNLGSEPLNSFRILFTDSLPQGPVTTLGDTLIQIQRFCWPDSLVFDTKLPVLSVGDHFIRIYVRENHDRRLHNNSIAFPVTISPVYRDVHINEIYTCGPKAENRWFELYNTGPVSVDPGNWRLYYEAGRRYKKLQSEHERLRPGEYLLICENEAAMQSACPGIKTGRMSSFPPLAGDSIFLRTGSGFIMDSCYVPQTDPAACSRSLERLPDTAAGFLPCPHPAGATPGEKNAAEHLFFDAALLDRSVTCRPPTPALEHDITLNVIIFNQGRLPTPDMDVLLLKHRDGDTLVVHSQTIGRPIAGRDSTQLLITLDQLRPARHDFTITLTAPSSIYRFNNSLCFRVDLPFPPRCVVLNEIMYDTDDKNMEYIEIFNPRSVPVDLENWHIKDRTKSTVLTRESFDIVPGGYAVISRAHLDVQELKHNLVVDGFPDLNNTGDDIALLDFTGLTIDSLSYDRTTGGGRNISLERCRFEDDTDREGNWETCLSAGGGTPGFLNSISPKQFDVSLPSGPLSFPRKPQSGGNVTFSVTVFNSGRRTLEIIRVEFFARAASESNYNAVCRSKSVKHLLPRDSCRVDAEWLNVPAGFFHIIAVVRQHLDQVSRNDSAKIQLIIGYSKNVVVLNEVMYSPASGKDEWIEIFNNSNAPVELKGWSIADADSQKAKKLSDSSLVLLKGQYGLIGPDPVCACPNAAGIPVKLPSLSNESDTLYLSDGTGNIIDRLAYNTSMGGMRGYSLERISPETDSAERSNWTTCVDDAGHTAGTINSVYTRVIPPAVRISVSPNPFSPDGDGIDDVTAVSYHCPALTVTVHIKIYDILGRPVRILQNNHPSGAHRTVFWDGRDDKGHRCRMGIYILLLQAMDSTKRTVHRAKTTVVLAVPL